MARKAADVYRDALALSEEEREELVRLLMMKGDRSWTDPENEKAALAEAERRHEAVLDGAELLVPGEEVMRELRDIVGK